MKGDWMSVTVLATAIMLSAVGLVYVKHSSRNLSFTFQQLNNIQDKLQVEWGQLQIELGTWSHHGRVERIARQQLHMQIPPISQMVIVKASMTSFDHNRSMMGVN